MAGRSLRTGAGMTSDWPRILKRTTTTISPWVELIARDVVFSAESAPETYHSVKTPDYVIALAVTPDGRIPLVTQYRPALEAFTLELPAGLADPGEDPAETASRELLEETGLPTRAIYPLGIAAVDSGRSSTRVHSYFVHAGERVDGFKPETGVTMRIVTQAEFVRLIIDGTLNCQVQLGTVLQAALRGHFKLPNMQ